jgi:DNA-binding XRE family transcriptional regulator
VNFHQLVHVRCLRVPGNLKRLRCGKGWTQTKAAEACGVAATSWTRWESHGHLPSLEKCMLIALGFGVEIGELWAE